MDYAATRDAPAGETAHLLPPSASGSEWIGGNTRGAAVAAFCLATLALASTASRGARGAATALGDSAPVGKLGYYFGPGELGQQPFFSAAGVGEGGVDVFACPYIDPAVGEYSVVANCLAGGPGCQENNMCRTCAVVESSDYPKCPYVVCLNFGLDPSTCDPNPGGESSELAAAETEPQAVETETEPQAVEAVTSTDGNVPSADPAFTETDASGASGSAGLGLPISDSTMCTGSKFATELRHSGKYLRTGFSYIPTPGGGKRPSLRLAPGQTVRAVMITPKGTLGRTSWRENGSWSDVRVSEEASSWNAFVSSDACGQPAFADGGFYVSPGEWNVYVSKAAVDVKGGFHIETWPSDSPFWSTWGGKTWAFGVVPGDLPGIQDGGCGEAMPIREEDFLMKVTWRSDGEGNHAGSHTVVARDEWGQTVEHMQTAEPGAWGLGGMKVRWMPVAESCASFPKTSN